MDAAVQAGDVIVFAKLDRSFRNRRDFENTMHTWRHTGITPVFLDLRVDGTTPQGELLLSMISAVSQFYSALLSQRSKEVWARLKREGAVVWANTILHKQGRKRRHLLDRERVVLANYVRWLHDYKGLPFQRIGERVETAIARRRSHAIRPLFERPWTVRRLSLLRASFVKYRHLVRPMAAPRESARPRI
jgi:DNA invertase Pin-like site-specific DNA recombinase